MMYQFLIIGFALLVESGGLIKASSLKSAAL